MALVSKELKNKDTTQYNYLVISILNISMLTAPYHEMYTTKIPLSVDNISRYRESKVCETGPGSKLIWNKIR